MNPEDLAEEVRRSYHSFKSLPDGRLCGIMKLLFHWTIHVDIDPVGYGDRYCYQTLDLAVEAMEKWDGTGDPDNWHRHPKSGRRRDLETGREWVNA